jgi:hypothetical protein
MRGNGEIKGAANEQLKGFFRSLDDHHLLRLANGRGERRFYASTRRESDWLAVQVVLTNGTQRMGYFQELNLNDFGCGFKAINAAAGIKTSPFLF